MNLDTFSQIGTTKTVGDNPNSKKNLIHTINQIRKNLANLHSTSSKEPKLEGIVRDLEGQSQNWEKLETKYF